MPSSGSSLLVQFQRLASSPDAHRRGRKLEELLEKLFQQAHFRVQRNAGISTPRQTDLVTRYGDTWYLIEAKWEKDPVDVSVFDAVRARMQRAASSSVVGVIISVSGFRKSAIEDLVQQRAGRPILLLGEEELTRSLDSPELLVNLLRLKQEALVTHGRVHRASAPQTERAVRPSTDLDAADVRLVDAALRPIPYVRGRGDFSDYVYTQELPDVDWVTGGGSGVSLDLPIRAFDEDGIAELLYALASMGWMTTQPRWNIQQATTNWHGIGAREFLDALRAWGQRFDGLDRVHHTEQITYFDVCQGGGFYTLSADVASDESRIVRRCNISFQLVGVPVDPHPLRHLFEQFDATAAGYFRPLATRAVIHRRAARDVPLEAVGYLVASDPFSLDLAEIHPVEDSSDAVPEEWVTGIIARNPFRGGADLPAPEDWPARVHTSELLVCDLRSHHPLDKLPDAYRLDSWQHAQTTDAQVFRPVADW
ncbi:restriction endonuclease [Streptomyces sp. NPDC056663]|uniref:restriction endonuclease n=1 Tax=Streptomyces sp. NPDC056663 TaxID=3345899 RepID=UPI0036A4A033